MPITSTWDPRQYNRFAGEREQPFWDLCSLLEPVVAARVADLGCGDGRLTAELHEHLKAASTVGIDSSSTMLAAAESRAGGSIEFKPGDIGSWIGEDLDVVFSNAALQWVPDHRAVLDRWRRSLIAGGQLAVQMPTNADHVSHRLAGELASEWLGTAAPPDPVAQNVLRPEQYSELLHALGFERQHVRLQVYGHLLSSSADVVEWVKGTSLTRLSAVMADDEFDSFVDEYRHRLLTELGDQQPYFYAFKRILMWAS